MKPKTAMAMRDLIHQLASVATAIADEHLVQPSEPDPQPQRHSGEEKTQDPAPDEATTALIDMFRAFTELTVMGADVGSAVNAWLNNEGHLYAKNQRAHDLFGALARGAAIVVASGQSVERTVQQDEMIPKCKAYADRTGRECALSLGHKGECTNEPSVGSPAECAAQHNGRFCRLEYGHDQKDNPTKHVYVALDAIDM